MASVIRNPAVQQRKSGNLSHDDRRFDGCIAWIRVAGRAAPA
jgi:hypothetical protein